MSRGVAGCRGVSRGVAGCRGTSAGGAGESSWASQGVRGVRGAILTKSQRCVAIYAKSFLVNGASAGGSSIMHQHVVFAPSAGTRALPYQGILVRPPSGRRLVRHPVSMMRRQRKHKKRIAVTSIESIAHIIFHQLIIESVVIVSQSPKLCNQVVLLLRLAISQRLWGTTNCCWPHRCLSSLRTHQLNIVHRWHLTVSVCRVPRLFAFPLVPFPFSL